MKRMMLLLALAAGCGPAADAAPRPVVVDSVFSVEESLARLRAGLPEPTGLAGGAASRDGLARDFVRALERADTAAAVRMHLSRAEFAWLYYPHARTPGAGTRMDPRLMWTLMRLESEKGLGRLFARLGGRPLGFEGVTCEAEPRREGPNRLWERCVVRLRTPTGVQTARLFGTILEREGRFRFVSYRTEL